MITIKDPTNSLLKLHISIHIITDQDVTRAYFFPDRKMEGRAP